MSTWKNIHLTALACMGLALGGCVEDENDLWIPSGERSERAGVVGGSCEGENVCGGKSPDGCWCDDLCQGYGDCCADYEPVCLDEPADEDEDGPVTAQDLLDLTANCERLPGTDLFATDAGKTRNIKICRLNGAIWWRADADIDCDGGKSSPCTEDPWYQPETSAKDSKGNFIDSATIPHFVVPLPSGGFDPKEHGIKTGWGGYGSAGAIIYNGKLLYAPYADAGPRNVLGELSAAAAAELGIPNNPVSGGVSSGVTYIVFTGENTYIDPIESRDAAESLGADLAAQLISKN